MDSHEQFSAWMSDNGLFPKAVERSGDNYKLMQTRSAWQTWQVAFAAGQASKEMDAKRLKPSSYRVDDSDMRIECVAQMDGSNLWAVRKHCTVMNNCGEWEWEPMPSGRDDQFFERCRFDDHLHAIDAALKAS